MNMMNMDMNIKTYLHAQLFGKKTTVLPYIILLLKYDCSYIRSMGDDCCPKTVN